MSKQPQAAPTSDREVVYLHRSYHIGELEGQLLTFMDASIQDPVQRKAVKDLLRPMLWRWAIETNIADNHGLNSDTIQELKPLPRS